VDVQVVLREEALLLLTRVAARMPTWKKMTNNSAKFA